MSPMNFLDVRTLLTGYVASMLICVIVLAALWLQNRDRFDAIRFWPAALGLQFVSLLLILLRGTIPHFLSIVTSGALAIFGAILLFVGLERFVGKPSPRKYNYGLLALFTLAHAYFTYVEPSLLGRNINYSVFLTAICAQGAWLMLYRVEPARRGGTRLVGAVLLGYCLLNIARIGVGLAAPPGDDPFRAGTFDVPMFLAYQILVVALTFSLVLMVNRRLHEELESDVEQRRLSETAVRLSEARLTRAELASKAGNWELRLDSREVIGSPGAAKVYGLNADRLDYGSIREIPLPEYRAELDTALTNLIQHGTPYDLEFKIRLPESGEIRDVHSIATFDPGSRTVFGIVQDITERKKAELELDRYRAHLEELVAERTRELAEASERLWISEERYGFALQATSDGIWDWNLKAEKTYVNSAYRKMLGYEAGDLGQDADSQFSSLLHPEEREAVMARVRELLEDPGSYEIEFRMRCKDGGYKWILSRGMAVQRDQGGHPIRAVGTHVDLTSRKLAEMQLRDAKEIAESANRAKSTFLANMSHELRTPMNAIMGMTGLALRGATEPKLRHQLATIAEASDRLLGVINDILDISKIEAEHMALEEIDFRLGGVFDDLLSLIGHKVTEKGLQLHLDLAPGIDRMPVRGDPMRLGQILLNIVGNAIKFADHGAIRIRCRSCGGGDADQVLRFEVADQGIGIAPEDQQRLFSAFVQADGSMTRKYGGTGLGLVISKRLVEMMGGVIGVDSAVGAGSTFWFTVVLRKGSRSTQPAPTPVAAADEGRLRAEHFGARILLAEDEPINAEVSGLLLEAVGLQVDHAEDGAAAVALASTRRYALILMDMQMPRLNGVDATRAIRALPGHERTPILAMTANAFDDDRQICLDAGMNDHISKPVNPDVLYRTVLKWLSPHAEESALVPRRSAR
ncbi:MAG: PAS domain-containing protein [Rhodocyclales bacterium]|nr:PAS domain-containing protein [Rhodocyclales bacterium]